MRLTSLATSKFCDWLWEATNSQLKAQHLWLLVPTTATAAIKSHKEISIVKRQIL